MPLWPARLRFAGRSSGQDNGSQTTPGQGESSTGRPPFESRSSDAAPHGVTTASSPQVSPARPNAQSLSPLQRHPSAMHFSRDPRNVLSGKCATCDFALHWAGNANGIRCLRCQMVHDLKPMPKDSADTNSSQFTPGAGATCHTSLYRRALPVSLEETKKLIDHCTLSLINSIAGRTRQESKADFAASPTERSSLVSAPLHNVHQKQSEERKLESDASALDLSNKHSEPNERYVCNQDICVSPTSTPLALSPNLLSFSGDMAPPPSSSSPLPPTDHQVSTTSRSAHTADVSGLISAEDVFLPLEKYLAACLTGCERLNNSFVISKPCQPVRATSEAFPVAENSTSAEVIQRSDAALSGPGETTLLLDDFTENGKSWTDGRGSPKKTDTKKTKISSHVGVRKTSQISWTELEQWYDVIYTCGQAWRTTLRRLDNEHKISPLSPTEELQIDKLLAQGRLHVRRTFMVKIRNVLIRPRKALKSPEDCRFLLILLANPLLYRHRRPTELQSLGNPSPGVTDNSNHESSAIASLSSPVPSTNIELAFTANVPGEHAGVIKRLLGLMANVSNECHQTLISTFRRFPDDKLQESVELVGEFVSYRLNRQSEGKPTIDVESGGALMPAVSGPGTGTSAHLRAAFRIRRVPKVQEAPDSPTRYAEDWQIKVAAKVMSLLFYANHSGRSSSHDHTSGPATMRSYKRGPIIPISTFYSTRLDQEDLIRDYLCWESRSGSFSFCQYPMFLSIGAKILLMEYNARRQMEAGARGAYFASILNRRADDQDFLLEVRRDCLVEDSFRGISEVGEEELKKALRIDFKGEEGVDAGGLRKEWFLLLAREVFNPKRGLFVYDEDSQYCYFNSHSFETSEQFRLVGVVLGLAIYNSTILDIALPPFAFRKLFASKPAYTGLAALATRPPLKLSLDDLAEWQPVLAKNLRLLLEYDGDVQETFCRTFVVEIDCYGERTQVQLCRDAENRKVTNSNRQEYVDLYVRYLLDTAVERQFEPFKRGFFAVCKGNALSLFGPEEIELLIRGSDEPLDVPSLRGSAVYEGWAIWGLSPEEDPSVAWFWDVFAEADLKAQRKLLGFITGSDRIPPTGTASLVLRLSFLGAQPTRLPIARTCFNTLGIYGYRTKEELETKLWMAVNESEGFGLK